jgi:hypothetical protein
LGVKLYFIKDQIDHDRIMASQRRPAGSIIVSKKSPIKVDGKMTVQRVYHANAFISLLPFIIAFR